MSKFSIAPYKKPLLVPEGSYEALIKEMKLGVNSFNQKDQIQVVFELLDKTLQKNLGQVLTISGYYTKTLHPQGNLVEKFIKPLLGSSFTEEECQTDAFELDQFLETKCEIQVEHHTKEGGEPRAYVSKVNRML